MNRNYVRRDQKMVVMMGASRGLHMNDLLDDQSLVDDHRDVPVGHRMNVMDVPNDLMTDVNLDVNRGRRMSDRLDDHSMGDGLMKGANHDHRMSDRLDDQNLVAKMDGNLYPRMNVMDDLNLDASRANRNCALHDQMKDVNLDAMSHHVMYY